jgi:hypothetical protein
VKQYVVTVMAVVDSRYNNNNNNNNNNDNGIA